ncbi:PulJ/GspJ family protein [Rhodoferax ferrireducens]|uniref:PulJ/GspJ family protein n=1 Tax=Rhodoferax ferrireducens TaxID=192843 RepID=UPI000E0E0138|nr:type II secretion system protein [Rhodoferax ferrireducens]
MRCTKTASRCQSGFTLVELIMVIVIMGVIGGIVSVFMKSPIDAYFASARRAALTDVADTAVRRIARDIRKALPNSIGTSVDKKCIEFIPTKTGGRYRAEETIAGDGSSLAFGTADTTFNLFGSNDDPLPADQRIAVNDVIAVSNFGFGVADAYAGSNTALISGVSNAPETVITIASTTFDVALASPNYRFQVIPANEKVVAFVCSGNNLYRVASTTLAHVCPVTVASTDPILARNVTSAECSFDYSGSNLQRNALVSMKIQMTDSGETVSLQHEVHVNNTP